MSRHLTAHDFERSRTSFNLTQVVAAIRDATAEVQPRSLLDVGCGYGGITATLRDALGIHHAHGVDVDPAVISEARSKGVDAARVEVGREALPYEDGSFDIVTSFGMLDYLPWYDIAVVELSRVLVADGLIAVALPNLGSWHNRLALLFGYQPRDVEFCSVRAVGLAPHYRDEVHARPVGHIHTSTTRAFREFMTLMGFREVGTLALRPGNNRSSLPVRAIDNMLSHRPSTARRFLYLGRRSRDPAQSRGDGCWSCAD
jgi:SAM-dependent methyltransferase